MRLPELLDLTLQELLGFESEETPETRRPNDYYLSALIAFFEGNQNKLEAILSEIHTQRGDDFRAVETLVSARMILLRREYSDEIATRLSALAGTHSELQGEAQYLLASLYFDQGCYELAEPLYHDASRSLQALGAKKKALNCLASAIAATSWIHPDKTFIAQYFSLYRQARRLRYAYVEGSALINISREYQKLGALGKALTFVTRALAVCKRDIGGVLYFSALAHYCDLLLDAGRKREALIALEFCRSCDFPEIQATARLLKSKLDSSAGVSCDKAELTPIWREKLTQWVAQNNTTSYARGDTLASMEEQLLHFVAMTPRTRSEMRSFLYGMRIPTEAADSRLKSVIERIRRKRPGLLQYGADEKYHLSSEIPIAS
jgi:tetratricopeptide (TPR) repeat protein